MTTWRGQPELPTPALDFLRRVEVWQKDATGTAAGLAVTMPEGEDQTLAQILAQAQRGAAGQLEVQARWWLIGYQEMNPPLTGDQRAELDAVIQRSAGLPHAQLAAGARSRRKFPVLLPAFVVLIAMIAITAVALLITHALAGSPSGSPPAAGAPVNPAQQPAQGGLTDLQRFRADWNVPSAASADAGNPAGLVLLQDGLYYPAPWSVPAGDAGWADDNSGTVGQAAIINGGSQIAVTDSNGTTWTVAPDQPFALASNPQLVLRARITHQGVIIQSIPDAHAIRVRTRL